MGSFGFRQLWILVFCVMTAAGQDRIALPSANPINPNPINPTPTTPSFSPSAVVLPDSMAMLNSVTKLGEGDRLSFRVVEERREPISLTVTDSGELEIPFIGRRKAAGKTCKELAHEIKPLLEREYFFKATVIIGIDVISPRSRGRVYITGQVRNQGPMEIPPGEAFTVSKALLRAGGMADFANRRKIKLVRKKSGNQTETTLVDLVEILDKGRLDKDPVLQADDLIIVPEKLINF